MYYLGVDGGGTKTIAILANQDGSVFRKIKLGAGNIAVLGKLQAEQLLKNTLTALLNGEPISEIHQATFAFAGAGRSQEKDMLKTIIKSQGLSNFTLLTDAEILYYGVFRAKQGILLAAGTGSICLVKSEDEFMHQIGGVGYLLGDEGSGFMIGTQAIRNAINEYQQNTPTSRLTQKLLTYYKLKQPSDLISLTYASKNPQNLVSACAKTVCDIAEKGDPTANEIVDDATTALITIVEKALRHLPKTDEYPIALSGSVLQSSSIVNHRFKIAAAQKGIPFKFIDQKLHPAAAAVIHAIKTTNKNVSETLKNQLHQIGN